MPLLDHYLKEDKERALEHIESLHRQCLKILECPSKGEFSAKGILIESIDDSLSELMYMNKKKLAWDACVKAEAGRRWF